MGVGFFCRRFGVLAFCVFICVLIGLFGSPKAFASSANPALSCASSLRLGAIHDAPSKRITFRVYSKNASEVELLLFAHPKKAHIRLAKKLKQDAKTYIWETHVSYEELQRAGWKMSDADRDDFTFPFYSYRAWGPNWPHGVGVGQDFDETGNRFNPYKAALDPYALEVSHDTRKYAHENEDVFHTGSARLLSSIERAPKGVVIPFPEGAQGARPTRAFKDEIIYELHVRGMTALAPGVAHPGTFAGLQEAIPYLKALGVTAVELLPVFEFSDDANQEHSTEGNNYWGYDPISFFAPNKRYVSAEQAQKPGGGAAEFTKLAEALHAAGIKLYLDVVYNHTAEGGSHPEPGRSKLLSWRALDNATYYQVVGDGEHFYDNTGCGANLNCQEPAVRELILDSLKYWSHLGVDGFRFDLATVLSLDANYQYDKLSPDTVFNRAVRELPARPDAGGEGSDIIVEPWGVGTGTFQLGNFPHHPDRSAGIAEWNGKFRDTLRRAENKWGVDSPTPAELATRLAGSPDLFAAGGKGPMHSINFPVSHDGFTLKDVVSYNEKHNLQGYPYGPTDGGDDNNYAWNHAERSDTPAETESRQKQGARNLMALTLLARGGVPMFTAGDEILRTQNGNNNAYRIDSKGNYFPWPNGVTHFNEGIKALEQNPFFVFTKNLISFRKAHESLRPLKYATGEDLNGNGIRDLSWYRANGTSAEERDLQPSEKGYLFHAGNGFLGMRVDAEEAGETDTTSIYVAYNWSHHSTRLTLPPASPGKQWYWQGDTDARFESRENFLAPGAEIAITDAVPEFKGQYPLRARSVAIFVEKP